MRGIMRGNQKFCVGRHPAKGFTVVEVVVTMFVFLVLSGIAVPRFLNILHGARLNGSISDFASLLQAQRIRAVDDDRFYSSYLLAATGTNPRMAFVDIFPQNLNGSSGTGGTTFTAGDPLVVISPEVSQMPASAAPNTTNLKQQVLPPSSPVVPLDGSANGTPITFGPRGLPCTPIAVVGGTVCDSLGGPTAYWFFFQNNVTQAWGAVTVTPAGRIRRWTFEGGAAGSWRNF
jgi:prepilin-type N-terminal cleavage/methylation domain-containing protein